MTSILTPQVILLAYWLVIIALAALFLRLACSLCQADIPSWTRAVISVILVTFLAYLTFDFTSYLIMRSMQDVVIQVPPGYNYHIWFREPIAFKWMVISHAGPLRYLGPIFALCVAGILQVIVLQAEVTFRWGLLIFVLQTVATAVAGYILALVLGVALEAIGWTPQPATVAAAPGQVHDKGGKKGPATAPHKEPASLQPPEQNVSASFQETVQNLKNYANSHLDDVKEELAPVTKHLPQPVNDFLDGGGWWLVLGVVGVIALLWLRSIVRRLRGALAAAMPKRKRKKRRTRVVAIDLKVKLAKIGEALTEEGDRRLTVNGVPARLRLVLMSLGTKNAGELTEEMADRVLDWIKPGLAELTSGDYPAVRVWPPFFSAGGFASAVAANVVFPNLAGERSHWVVLVGQVKMGQAVVNVALGLYADEPHSMRTIKVTDNQWLGVLSVQEPRRAAMAR
jgi:hypothetical protein